uniref:Uncharacterized protein n=1 Tax=Anopheles epiroticus TaxID=199890 RepID=A0A182PHF6_9DIPT
MSASPEMQHQHQQLQQEANAPLVGEMKPNSVEGTPPPELATMTTVSVLDLHKDYNGGGGNGGAGGDSGAAAGTVTSPHIVHDGATDMSLPDDGTTEKVYDKETNTMYVYTTADGVAGHKLVANPQHHQLTTIVHGQQQQQQQHQQMSSPDQLHQSEHHTVAEQNLLHARLIQQQQAAEEQQQQQQQHLQRMSPGDQHQQHHQQHAQVHPDDGSIIDGHRLLPATINGNDAGDPQQHQQQQHHHLGRLSPEGQQHQQQQGGVRLLEDSHIQRLLGNQEIISRDIINGEHHIITRNENGETILTRIAISTADQLLNRMDNSIIYTTTGGSSATGVVGVGPQEQLPTTVLQYEKDVEDKQQPLHHAHPHTAHQPQTIYATAGGAADQAGQTKQIVYTLGGGEPKNVIYGDPKAAMPHFETVSGTGGAAGGAGGTGGSGSVDDDKPQIDYVYNEGNKTVIYTDQKGLESLYANNELGLMDGTQIVVQGNLQYTQQQGPDGTTVYVVSSDMNPEDISGLQQR